MKRWVRERLRSLADSGDLGRRAEFDPRTVPTAAVEPRPTATGNTPGLGAEVLRPAAAIAAE